LGKRAKKDGSTIRSGRKTRGEKTAKAQKGQPKGGGRGDAQLKGQKKEAGQRAEQKAPKTVPGGAPKCQGEGYVNLKDKGRPAWSGKR